MADIAWIGGATNVAQQETITLGGTWVVGETIILDLGGAVKLKLTIGSTSIDNIGSDLVYMLLGTGTLTSGSTVTGIGTSYGEFKQISAASYATNVLTITGKTDGRPFTLSNTGTTTSGTTVLATSVSASGSHNFGTAENWDGGTAPSTSDNIVLDKRAQTDLKYDLDQNSVAITGFDYRKDCTVNVGLKVVNDDDISNTFVEMLPTHLHTGASGSVDFKCGVNGSATNTSMGWVKFDGSGADLTGTVDLTAVRSGVAPLNVITGSTITSTWTVNKGDVEFGVGLGNTAEVDTLNVAYIDDSRSDSKVAIGPGNTIGTINMSGGTVDTLTAPTTVNGKGGGGVYRQRAASSSTNFVLEKTTLSIEGAGGSGTITAYDGGLIDLSKSPTTKTIGAVDLYKGSGWNDPQGVASLSAGLDINGCKVSDLSVFDVGTNRKITPGTVS